MLKKFSLKLKVLLMFFPLVLGFFASSIYVVKDYYNQGQQFSGLKEVADAFDDFGNLIHNLQIERGKTTLYFSQKISLDDLLRHRKDNIDKYLIESKRMINILPFPSDALKNLQVTFLQIDEVRKKVDSNQTNAADAAAEFSHIIQELIVGEGIATTLYSGKGIELRLVNFAVVETLKESIGKTRAMYSGVFAKNLPVSLQDIGKIESVRAGIKASATSPSLQLVPALYNKAQEILKSHEWAELSREMDLLSSKGTTGNFGVDSQSFFQKITVVIENFNSVLKSERTSVLEYAGAEAVKAHGMLLFVVISFCIFTIGVGMFSYITLKELISNLESIVTELTSSGKVVADASLEILNSSTMLSSSVTEQASAIHETSSSLTEIAGMVEANVKSAESANTLAQKIYAISADTEKTMEDLVKAMIFILESNARIEDLVKVIGEIGEKTDVIDDIVFKTQLLSFNASVEAERAGEHGRGFSVVAQEVGNLAQMSGKAATEISSIVKTSIKEAEAVAKDNKGRVERGGVLAEETKQKMVEILRQVKEILDVTSKITSASREQSLGINQISTSVDSLNQTIQQTTTTAQESASASEQLSAQSESLMALVDDLKVSIDGTKA